MEIDWTVLTYLVVGFFALNGFMRGWWKEAITTLVLVFLLFLLQQPDLAQSIIDAINSLIGVIVELIPASVRAGAGVTESTFQLDANRASTWIVILLVLLGLAVLISRSGLPSGLSRREGGVVHALEPIGRILGLVVGGVNGFLVLSLVREYLDGRSLPGNAQVTTASGGLKLVGGSAFGPPAPTVSVQATNLPNVTIMDSFIPWLIIAGGIIVFIIAFRNRYFVETDQAGGRRFGRRSPYGYRELPFVEPPPRR